MGKVGRGERWLELLRAEGVPGGDKRGKKKFNRI